jgi:hypothetical protein
MYPLLLAVLLLTGCASVAPIEETSHFTLADSAVSSAAPADVFTPAQAARVSQAVQRTNVIVTDSTFVAVMRDLEANRRISWRGKSLELLPRDARALPASWLLARFAREGNYTMAQIGARNFPDPLTTASTAPCDPADTACALETDLGIQYVEEATVDAIANTLVHERVHSFGQKHARGQSRKRNLCDASYIMGDLAEALLRYRDTGAAVTPREDLCPALHDRLERDGIVN